MVGGPRAHIPVFVKKFFRRGNKDFVSLSLVLVRRCPLFVSKGKEYPLKGGVCPSFVYLRYMTSEAGLRVCVFVRVRGVSVSFEVSPFFLVNKDCECLWFCWGGGPYFISKGNRISFGGAGRMPFVVLAVCGR